MQAVVSERAVAVTVAGLLVENFGDRGGHFVGRYLVRVAEILAG